ncbi:TonB-dependent receptor domain-containing protein [Paremcibacter congregatus]|mgnify:CR=1 FL=1|uniref:TonB-dependent receptor domain-containing protein n=1 Tax=Paremcibacter congregatus TaxID=2043170 RepID=UPI0030EE570B|tara:strand:+ start:10500 stop:13985 length:3486 start_codon:yes stop_codon:yes gene_type:complete
MPPIKSKPKIIFLFALAALTLFFIERTFAANAASPIAAELSNKLNPAQFEFLIPQSSVADALILFAEQTGEKIVFRFDDANQVPARKLFGQYSPIEALLHILHDTGLIAFRNPEGTIVVQKVSGTAPAQIKTLEQTKFTHSSEDYSNPSLISTDNRKPLWVNSPEEIIITGSRLKRLEYVSPNLISTIHSETIKLTNTANIEEILNKLPQIKPALTGNSNNPGNGIATVDMRGLGATRTLVLVDGRRYVPSSQTGVTDMNSIPTFLVDKIEVATGGTSAVYGSDAIAGVVNFKLRKNIEGFEGLARYRISHLGDGEKYDINVVYGHSFPEERGHAILHFGIVGRQAVNQQDRSFSNYSLIDSFISPGSTDSKFGFGQYLSPNSGGIPGLINYGSPTIPEGYAVGISPAGPYPGLERFGPKGESLPFNRTLNGYNFASDNFLQLPQRQIISTLRLNYLLTEKTEFFNQVIFSKNKVAQRLSPTPVGLKDVEVPVDNPFLQENARAALRGIDWYGTGLIWQARDAAGNLLLNSSGHPIQARQATYNTYNMDGTLATKTPLWNADGTPIAHIGDATSEQAGRLLYQADNRSKIPLLLRRMSELGSRNIKNNRRTINAVIGLKGQLTHAWDYVTHYNYSHFKNINQLENGIFEQKLYNALNIIKDDNNLYVCQNSDAREEGCAPANLFGANNLSPEAISYIQADITEHTTYTRQDATAYFNGTFDHGLQDGIKILIGMDWRKESSRYKGRENSNKSSIIGFNRQTPANGQYNVWSIFSEGKIPFVEDRPLIKLLELSGALRYSHYSITGGVWTYAAGINWQPLPSIRVRGQFQHAVREPNIQNIYAKEFQNFVSIVDPCATNLDSRGNIIDTTDIQSECQRTGVPSHLVGQFTQLTPQVNELNSGNLNLEAETSNTFTAGLVFQPTAFPNLQISFDYYRLSLDNIISSYAFGAYGIINSCYRSKNSIPQACRKIHRTPDGHLAYIDAQLVNGGERITSGLDGQLYFYKDLNHGLFGYDEQLEIILQGSYLLSHRFRALKGDKYIECAGYFSSHCQDPFPRFQLTQLTTWRNNNIELSLRWRHIGPTLNKQNTTVSLAVPKLSAKNYFDIYLQHHISDNSTLRTGVNNIFNSMPDFVGSGQQQANTFPNLYDTLGTYFQFGINIYF